MKIVSFNGELAWAIVAYYVIQNGNFLSLKKIKYNARFESDAIYFSGGKRIDEEIIPKQDFIKIFDAIQHLGKINTNTVKPFFAKYAKNIYAKHSPFIGLLLSSGILK